MKKDANPVSKVLDIRRIMGISDLTDIPNLAYNAAFRAQVKNNKIDTYFFCMAENVRNAYSKYFNC